MSKFLCPRTTTAARTAVIPEPGEILYDTELRAFYGGDGVTPGGIPLSDVTTAEEEEDSADE